MKTIEVGAGVGVGYVRAVFSQRARGFAVPLDLVRVVCRVAGRVATRQRIGDAFKGYLVSESGQVAEVFADRRGIYEGTRIFRAGWGPRRDELQHWAWDAGAADGCSLDAACWIAAWSVSCRDGYEMASSFIRGWS